MLARLFVVLLALMMAGPAVAADDLLSAYDFTFTSIEGRPLPLSTFEGKVVLVVNTASFCGFTHQYADLQQVWDRYRDRDFVLLGIPSNDFGAQEPGSAEEIKTFCTLNYGIDFPITEKVHVRGDQAHPFYKWAAWHVGSAGTPRWNFHKYLIAADGSLSDWFSTETSPTSREITQAIEAQLARRAALGG